MRFREGSYSAQKTKMRTRSARVRRTRKLPEDDDTILTSDEPLDLETPLAEGPPRPILFSASEESNDDDDATMNPSTGILALLSNGNDVSSQLLFHPLHPLLEGKRVTETHLGSPPPSPPPPEPINGLPPPPPGGLFISATKASNPPSITTGALFNVADVNSLS